MQKILLGICVLSLGVNIVLFGVFLKGDTVNNQDFNTSSGTSISDVFQDEDTSEVTDVKTSAAGEDINDVIESDIRLATNFWGVNVPEDFNLFDDFYSKFEALNTYEDYKEYIENYPSLLPVIYAVKIDDKESYTKFYSFIYEVVLEENVDEYMEDIRQISIDKGEPDVKKAFVDTMNEHFDRVTQEGYSFDLKYGYGPIHAALNDDSVEDALSYCEEGGITNENELTLDECSDFVYQYRANTENNYCGLVIDDYEREVCNDFFSSTYNN